MEPYRFLDVGSLFPDDIEPPATVPPNAPVRDALNLMLDTGCSHLPVRTNGTTSGMLSLWSVVRCLQQTPDLPVEGMSVEEIMDRDVPTIAVDASLDHLLNLLGSYEAVLIASPHGIQAIATHGHVLEQFDRIARPFLLIREIELALRALLRACATDDVYEDCVDRAREARKRKKERPPGRDRGKWSLGDYISLIECEQNWIVFQGTFGTSRERAITKLNLARQIRNRVFHFEPGAIELSRMDLDTLIDVRNWL